MALRLPKISPLLSGKAQKSLRPWLPPLCFPLLWSPQSSPLPCSRCFGAVCSLEGVCCVHCTHAAGVCICCVCVLCVYVRCVRCVLSVCTGCCVHAVFGPCGLCPSPRGSSLGLEAHPYRCPVGWWPFYLQAQPWGSNLFNMPL